MNGPASAAPQTATDHHYRAAVAWIQSTQVMGLAKGRLDMRLWLRLSLWHHRWMAVLTQKNARTAAAGEQSLADLNKKGSDEHANDSEADRQNGVGSSDEETHDDQDLAANDQTSSTFFWQFAEFAEANSETGTKI